MSADAAYRQAEELIEDARQTRAKRLILSGDMLVGEIQTVPVAKLRTLPEQLFELKQLEELVILNNQLTTLPEQIGELTQLRRLMVYGQQLTELPEAIGELTKLRALSVGQNRIRILPGRLFELTELRELNLFGNELTALPESIGELAQLEALYLAKNLLRSIPMRLFELKRLKTLSLSDNLQKGLPRRINNLASLEALTIDGLNLTTLSDELFDLRELTSLSLGNNCLRSLPAKVSSFTRLRTLNLQQNQLTSLPAEVGELQHLQDLHLDDNPLHPELAAAYEDSTEAVLRYLRAKRGESVELCEAKLILVGEGEVGKSCLLDALRGESFRKHESTEGIQVESFEVAAPSGDGPITLNGWDFGGQKVYRPTHQLFFSSPAVYLVVWKPREGSQAGQVKEWIKLVLRREPEAKLLIVATHGGPDGVQPDLDGHSLRQEFGEESILGFFHVDSMPDGFDSNDEATWNGPRAGVEALRDAIAEIAAELPEVRRTTPRTWHDAWDRLVATQQSWMTYADFAACCTHNGAGMPADEVPLFAQISHRLGRLIHYHNDPVLHDFVILRPDWLARAIGFILADKQTRERNGLVDSQRLCELWNDPKRDDKDRYPAELHEAFLRLMARFDLSYEVEYPQPDAPRTMLIGPLVNDVPPEFSEDWDATPNDGDLERVQVCRIVDGRGDTAEAEGLFFQLIVRLHKFSLGREDYDESVHWKRGLLVDDVYNGRALLEHIGNDVRITVRAAYPECFLAMLTSEVRYLVNSFWEGLRCNVMVPCIEPCGLREPGRGLFDYSKLVASRRRKQAEFPCPAPGCEAWQEIDGILRTSTGQAPSEQLGQEAVGDLLREMQGLRADIVRLGRRGRNQFLALARGQQRILSQADEHFTQLLNSVVDEAKDGPRLFSLEAVKPGFLSRPNWIGGEFRLTLWCEHARVPLPLLYGGKSKRGVYKLTLNRAWLRSAAPYLKALSTTLRLVLPAASALTELMLDDDAFKAIDEQLKFGDALATSLVEGGGLLAEEDLGSRLLHERDDDLIARRATRGEGSELRYLQALLKEKDPASSFGGLVRVQNRRGQYLWVHPQFKEEYL